METIVLAIAAVLLLGVQTHRNYLMVQASRKQSSINVVVQPAEIDYDSLARAMEASWPTVNVTNEQTTDYSKLSDAIKKALIESGVALHNAQLPVVVPVPPAYPTPPSPIYYPVISETSNEIEVDGVKGKQFPAR